VKKTQTALFVPAKDERTLKYHVAIMRRDASANMSQKDEPDAALATRHFARQRRRVNDLMSPTRSGVRDATHRDAARRIRSYSMFHDKRTA
jgi:hypothetical protein